LGGEVPGEERKDLQLLRKVWSGCNCRTGWAPPVGVLMWGTLESTALEKGRRRASSSNTHSGRVLQDENDEAWKRT
jgi:hypothetical protein